MGTFAYIANVFGQDAVPCALQLQKHFDNNLDLLPAFNDISGCRGTDLTRC